MMNSSKRSLRVGIVGGGIGGLALAAALKKFGVEAHVFERASAFGEVGAGIQMTPNAVKIMRDLGVWEALEKVSFLPQCIVGRNWRTGAEIFRTPLSSDCPQKFVNPQFPFSAGEKKSRRLHTFPRLHPRELFSQPGHRTVMYCAGRRMYRGIDLLSEVGPVFRDHDAS